MIRLAAHMHNDPDMKKRFGWYVLATTVVIPIMSWGYSVLGFVFATFPRDYQWILGLLSPLVRDLLIFMIQECVYRAGGKGARNQYSIRLTSSYYMEMRHAIFLAIILGSIATPITCYCVIGIKITYSCFRYSHDFSNGYNFFHMHTRANSLVRISFRIVGFIWQFSICQI